MRVAQSSASPLTGSAIEPPLDTPLGDLRFRSLLSEDEWRSLPLHVRQRFSKCVADGKIAVFIGHVLESSFSKLGWALAQAARLIGGPFPISGDVDVASVVSVTEDFQSGGQIWTRLYACKSGFPHIVHSCKRFAGPTGLEEHVGFGIGMTLRVSVEDCALTFRSSRYFVDVAGFRLYLPAWATPGSLTVVHRQADGDGFTFLLEVMHPRFGLLIRQLAAFKESGRHV